MLACTTWKALKALIVGHEATGVDTAEPVAKPRFGKSHNVPLASGTSITVAGPSTSDTAARPPSNAVVVKKEQDRKCYKCDEAGHYSRQCTKPKMCQKCHQIVPAV